MLFTRVDQLGNWNPQLLRELKGRLKFQNIAITVAVSLASQCLLLLNFWSQLPSSESSYSDYCTGGGADSRKCISHVIGQVDIDWVHWWSNIFQTLSWMVPLALILGGAGLLILDLVLEERRGTLNFIRLSPHPRQNILVGKLLGVPALLYLAGSLFVPLHMLAALHGGMSFLDVLGVYTSLAGTSIFVYSAALLFGISGGLQVWLGSVLFLPLYLLALLNIMFASKYSEESMWWFGIPLWQNRAIVLSFTLFSLGIGTYWIWQSLNRCFQNPSSVMLSKKQSYWATASFEIFAVGFLLFNTKTYALEASNYIFLAIAHTAWFASLTFAMSPRRQTLLDWSRYRREHSSKGNASQVRSLFQDLLWNEKSPALVAMGMNLLISAVALSLWIALWPVPEYRIQGFLGLFFTLSLILIYSAMAQFLLFAKTRWSGLWVAGTVGAMMLVPTLTLSLLSLWPQEFPVLWLFSAFPLLAVSHASPVTILAGLLGHFSILGLLAFQLTRQLQKAGESNLKTLFEGRPSKSPELT